ncbi:hypothetical protein DPMN_181868 [Dreissena polymorpha]|uniref:Uncharacterized protein n=1 Tax=Dreissena polymorpha TaxID=45954 RepID=A0A9D4DEG5_DREPO|nr:hypothetical protein DPMN_181868 [Dreissena polymorpha]
MMPYESKHQQDGDLQNMCENRHILVRTSLRLAKVDVSIGVTGLCSSKPKSPQ